MQKHRQVSKELRTEIATGRYGVAGRLPSEAQLVERFGVSRPTIGRALQDLQNEGLVERRAGSGSFVRPQAKSNETHILGLLVPGRGSTEVLDLICGEIGAMARLRNYGLLWGRSAHPLQDRTLDAQLAEEACQQFIEREVRGVFFAPFEHLENCEQVNRRLLDSLQQSGIPVVLLDRDITRFPLRSSHDLIALDNVQAGFLAADHLIRLGCREVRLLAEPGAASSVDARAAGIREALLLRGIPLPRELRIAGDPTDSQFIRKSVCGRGIDAMICANDYTAARLLKTLGQVGISVPQDIRLIGFDDARYATLVAVSLTTIHQPSRDIATVAFRALEARIRDASLPTCTMLLDPTLVVRDSCGAYANPAQESKSRTPRRK
ncbi:MAG: GntR family transcriptional regulator [Planctomycetota bacterium]|nr:MAG: GntR family transcriptional regulator [Planctomycetota bacterium]